MRSSRTFALILFLSTLPFTGLRFQQPDSLIGRWDLTIQGECQTYPGWLEVSKSGTGTLVVSAMIVTGSARPISEVHFSVGNFSFSLPPQWIGPLYLHLSGKLESGRLKGNLLSPTAEAMAFTGGALDSEEATPGPIMLQGDHGPVEYRNMTISVPLE